MNSDIKKTGIILILIFIAGIASADIWKPMNAGLNGIPLISTQGNGFVAMVTGGKNNAFGKEYNLNIWNGFAWAPPIPFTTDSVAKIKAMEVYDGSIYFAGAIQKVKGLNHVANIFRFNLKERSFQSITNGALVDNMNEINDLAVYGGKLAVGGSFTKVQNVVSNNLIYYNGTAWVYPGLDFGAGFDGPVTELTVFKDTLFAGGLFKNANLLFSPYFAAYYNGSWKRYENTAPPIGPMAYYDNFLITAIKDGQVQQFHKVTRSGISPIMNGMGAIYLVKELIVHNGHLWAAGLFQLEGESDYTFLIRYVNGKWQDAPGAEYMTNVNTLVVLRDRLYAGGHFLEPTLGLKNSAEFAPGQNLIQGRVYYDKDNNCHFDNRDEFLSQHLVVIQPGNIYAKPNIFGTYRVFLPQGKYEVSTVGKKYWTSNTCSSSYTLELGTGVIHDSVDFALKYSEPVEDVNVELSSLGGWKARDGMRNFYVLQYGNLGSENIRTGKLELEFDESLGKGFQAFPAPDSLDNNRAVWLYSNLLAGEVRKLAYSVEIPDAFPQSEITYSAVMSPTPNETAIEDNQSTLYQEITDSTYLTQKQIYPSPAAGASYAVIPDNEREVAFNISFINYSYDTVRTIYVIDTLDTDLDIQFIQETGATHSYTTKVINGPAGSNTAIVIWTFEDINLNPNPNKINDMANYGGYIGFKFRFNSNLPIGTVITNRARIIMDYEYEEMTNMVEGRVEKAVSVQRVNPANEINVFPNPVTGEKVTLIIPGIQKSTQPAIVFMDMIGRTWNAEIITVKDGKVEMNVSALPSGTYIICAEGGNKTSVIKRINIIR